MKLELGKSQQLNSVGTVIGAGVLAFLLIGYLLVRPAWNKLHTLGQEIPVAKVARDQAKLDTQNLEDAKQFFANNREALTTVNTALPIQADVPTILAQLESLARQNNVFLTSFAPQQVSNNTSASSLGTGGLANQATAPAGVSVVEVSAQYSGSYSSLINYFYSLEKSLRLVDVKTLGVTTSQGDTVQGSLVFRAYYLPVDGGPKPTSTK